MTLPPLLSRYGTFCALSFSTICPASSADSPVYSGAKPASACSRVKAITPPRQRIVATMTIVRARASSRL